MIDVTEERLVAAVETLAGLGGVPDTVYWNEQACRAFFTAQGDPDGLDRMLAANAARRVTFEGGTLIEIGVPWNQI